MTLIDRYLFKTLLQSALATLLVLMSLDLVVEISSEAKQLSSSLTFGDWLRDFIYQLPEKIKLYLPAAVLMGSLIGLGQHAEHSELTVLQATGCSQFRLARSGIMLTLLLGIIALMLQECSPKPTRTAQSKALWLNDGVQMVQIGEQRGNTLHELHFYRAEPLTFAYAQSAEWNGTTWQLHHAYQQTLTANALSPQIPLPTWQSALLPQELQMLSQRHSLTTLREQHQLIALLERYQMDSQRERLHYYQQLTLPLTALTMLLLALPFAFGHSRFAGKGGRLLVGILLGLLFYLVQGMMANLTLLLGWSPLVAVLMPNLLFASYPIYHLRQH